MAESAFKPCPYLLKGEIQYYAWGTMNEKAFIPQILGIETEPDKPYAELWMGAHPKAPAKILFENKWVLFDQLIKRYPYEILGKKVCDDFAKKLPFLFKILSANEALSIQAHPNKEQAKKLYAKDPVNYPDDNHKPEIAIALDDLKALAGFKSVEALLVTFETYPEISGFIGNEIIYKLKNGMDLPDDELKSLIKEMYILLMENDQNRDDELAEAIEKLDTRLRNKSLPLTEVEQIFLNLRKTYPGADPGLFALFLLNLIHLKAGQGLFLHAGLPHTYLAGNIVECMANSDNVVRAGLTPKFQDIETLIEILTYETNPVKILEGEKKNKEVVYNIPAQEFAVSRIELKKGAKIKQTVNSVQILLVTEGQIHLCCKMEENTFPKGSALLIPACLGKYRLKSNNGATVFKVSVP